MRSLSTATPYGPMFILVAAFAVWVGSNLTGALVLFRLITLAGMAAIAAGLPAIASRCGVDPRRAVWVALAGPLIGAHLLGAPHNDAVMLGFAVLGFLLIVRASSHPVALLAGGRIAAVGTHSELLAAHPAYRDLLAQESDLAEVLP